MNRQTFNALCAQYATPEVSGEGLVSWEGGKKCVIPSIKLYGAAVQDGEPTLENPVMPVCNNGAFASRGRNLLDLPREITSGELCDAPASGLLMMYLPAGVSITAGRWIRYNAGDDATNRRLTILCTYEDGTYVSARTELGLYENDGQWHYESISVTPVKPVKHIQYWLADYSTFNARDYDIRDAQLVIGTYTSDTMPPYTPYYDGGQAQAPELWAIPGTEYRDEWNPQTGRGIRRCGVIDSYAGEVINMPYLSSTGALTEGATVIYGIPDMPFTATPAKLTMPTGYGQIIQVSGDAPDCPITARYLTHS